MKGLNVVQELGYIGLGRQEGAGTDVGGAAASILALSWERAVKG